ncbi:MAG TPA: Crp/Fnr family transcriptional regulator [Flavisolibacter sp.]|jgi:CRP-like cAMP-binding protein|nr:Crp/Fnr family transcriptional regulator [Flavisolibacter sp.]
MEPVRSFLTFLNKFIPLTEGEFKELIQPYIELRQFKKKESITKAGDVEQYLNFVVKGLVRKYFKNGDEELITQISREGQIIHSQGSFHRQLVSHYFVEAIEPTTLLSINYDNLNRIFSTNAKMEKMGRLFVIDILVLNDRWQMMLLKMSPRERFLEFVQRNPEMMQRVPQKFLASLLNIQPETFSRFKHLLRPATSAPKSAKGENPASAAEGDIQ